MEVDILAIGAHPDDVELACSGTILKHIDLGYTCAIVDLTQGELGTRGNPALRLEEAQVAAQFMGIKHRENLGLADAFFTNDHSAQLTLAKAIRKFRPKIILGNAVHDRHPDHPKAAKLIQDACFVAGLRKVETLGDRDEIQAAWRPQQVYHYVQDHYLDPDMVVDITPYLEKRMKAIMKFESQFYNPSSAEPSSPISSREFAEFLRARAREFGRMIGVEFGEGFTCARPIKVNDAFQTI